MKRIYIELDKRRELILNLNAMCNYEQETGEKFNDIDYSNMSMSQMRVFIWCLLHEDDEELTVKDMGKLFTIDSAGKITDAIQQVMQNGQDEKKQKKNQAATSTGK